MKGRYEEQIKKGETNKVERLNVKTGTDKKKKTQRHEERR
jgi:hypothetical protein